MSANNRQLRPTEETWIKNNAERYATQKGIHYDQAVQELTAQGDRQVQNGSPGAWDQDASAFLSQAKGMLAADGASGPGYMFYATPDQKANPAMYAGFGGTNTPSAADLAAAINRDQVIRQGVSDATLGAAGIAGAIAGAGPLSAGAMDAYAAYKAAAAGYSRGLALGSGMAIGGASYTGGAAGGAFYDKVMKGQSVAAGFDQRFSYPGLGAAMAVGGLTGMYSTAMFGWAGLAYQIPSKIGRHCRDLLPALIVVCLAKPLVVQYKAQLSSLAIISRRLLCLTVSGQGYLAACSGRQLRNG
ncbi:hypothetical protein [Collimonas sp.]|uniref:hypothetical protein n=1 Tax=Collimonas sp. TaxID=1963772 RepID=UPI002BEB4379|nr:hypothetical protein [Collimonas sp.]HWW06824.1 hypothetical protein [Collimonas sp.]